MARTKKTKVQIKRTTTSLGPAYRIIIDGRYAGTALTKASAQKAVPRLLAIHARIEAKANQ